MFAQKKILILNFYEIYAKEYDWNRKKSLCINQCITICIATLTNMTKKIIMEDLFIK